MLAVLAIAAYAADQLSKAWAVSSLRKGEQHQVIGELLQVRRTANPGAAFSIATNATWVLTIIASCVIIATIYLARRLRSRGWATALGLLIGGALGNLTDRFFREPGGGQGHVVDFLELPNWPIFNVADICIVSAAVLICLLAFRGIAVDGSRIESNKKPRGPQDTPTDDAQPPADAAPDEPSRRP